MAAVAITFLVLGTFSYFCAAFASLAERDEATPAIYADPFKMLIGGAVFYLLLLVVRLIQWGSVPLTSLLDTLTLFTIFCSLIVLVLARKNETRPLLIFYAPPIAFLALLNAVFAYTSIGEEPRALYALPLVLHVGLVFFAYALFFIASMTSIAYVIHAKQLKHHHRAKGFIKRMPSLETLDATLVRLIGYGYPVFVFTMLVGFVWALTQGDLLGSQWFLSPKILLSVIMVLFYAVAFHARRWGSVRGRKLAYLVFFGFSVLLIISLTLGLLDLRSINFWNTTS